MWSVCFTSRPQTLKIDTKSYIDSFHLHAIFEVIVLAVEPWIMPRLGLIQELLTNLITSKKHNLLR